MDLVPSGWRSGRKADLKVTRDHFSRVSARRSRSRRVREGQLHTRGWAVSGGDSHEGRLAAGAEVPHDLK
jgi:hypothetical protein